MNFKAEERYNALVAEQNRLNLEVKKQKAVVHQEYMSNHKRLIRLLDVLVVLAILFNIGALIITNALVMRVEPAKVFHEVNPVQCGLQGFNCSVVNNTAGVEMPNYSALLGFMFHAFGLGVIIALYIRQRIKVSNDQELFGLISFACLVCVMCTLDFTNDFGYYIGKLIWGV